MTNATMLNIVSIQSLAVLHMVYHNSTLSNCTIPHQYLRINEIETIYWVILAIKFNFSEITSRSLSYLPESSSSFVDDASMALAFVTSSELVSFSIVFEASKFSLVSSLCESLAFEIAWFDSSFTALLIVDSVALPVLSNGLWFELRKAWRNEKRKEIIN